VRSFLSRFKETRTHWIFDFELNITDDYRCEEDDEVCPAHLIDELEFEIGLDINDEMRCQSHFDSPNLTLDNTNFNVNAHYDKCEGELFTAYTFPDTLNFKEPWLKQHHWDNGNLTLDDEYGQFDTEAIEESWDEEHFSPTIEVHISEAVLGNFDEEGEVFDDDDDEWDAHDWPQDAGGDFALVSDLPATSGDFVPF